MTLPQGTVTFLFTDVEGSTRLLEQEPERYAQLLAQHRTLVREACAAGHEVDTQGDAFFFAFARADDAVAAAEAAQAALAQLPLKVRMGLHTGQPTRAGDDYVGIDVHRAARIASAAHGGQILLSQTTHDLVPHADVVDLGEHRLKDLTLPARLYQLGHAVFPPPHTLENRPTNLPAQPWPLVGRDRELAELTGLLRGGGPRLVTVTGPAGGGKTRLALQAAAELLDEREDGVWYVALESVREAQLVRPTVAAALAVPEGELDRHLEQRSLLLVLDNLEHLLDAAADVAALASPTVSVLVTSRAPLRVTGEQEYPLGPLPVDDGVELFVERARAVRPAFREATGTLGELVRRLDGLPLAIELAAARVRLLTPEAILDRIDHRLTLLTGGARDRPTRQQTLRGAIEWSYGLLGEEERRLFARLAVFHGGFDLEAAEAVCDATLDGIETLVESSLVRAEDDRFSLLESIRELAVERLAESGELEELVARHAAHYLLLGEQARTQIRAACWLGHWMDWCTRELDNCRAAVATFRRAGDLESEARAVLVLVGYLQARGRLRESVAVLDEIAPRTAELDPALRVWLDQARGQAAFLGGDGATARRLALSVLDTAQRLGLSELEVIGTNGVALAALRDGDFDEAERWFERYEEVARRSRPDHIMPAVNNRAVIQMIRGDLHLARTMLEGIDDPNPTVLHNIGLSYLFEDDDESALEWLRRSMTSAWQARHDGILVYGLNALAAARAETHPEVAGRVRGAADALGRRLGVVIEEPDAGLAARTERELRARLGADYQALLAAGATLAPDEAAALGLDLDQQGVALAAAGADRREA